MYRKLNTLIFITAVLVTFNASAENCPEEIVQKALSAEDAENIDLAIDLHENAIAQSSTCHESATAISGLYGLKHNFEMEINWANRSLKIKPTVRAYINLGNAYALTGQPRIAMTQYMEAGKTDPKSPLPPYSAGTLTEMLSQSETDSEKKKKLMQFAVIMFERAIELDQKFFAAHYSLATSQANLGNWDSAISEIEIALELNPSDEETKNLMIEFKRQKANAM